MHEVELKDCKIAGKSSSLPQQLAILFGTMHSAETTPFGRQLLGCDIALVRTVGNTAALPMPYRAFGCLVPLHEVIEAKVQAPATDVHGGASEMRVRSAKEWSRHARNFWR